MTFTSTPVPLLLLGAVAAGAVGYAMGEALARVGVWAEKLDEDEFRLPSSPPAAALGAPFGFPSRLNLGGRSVPTPRPEQA